jgi:hypothetical protein
MILEKRYTTYSLSLIMGFLIISLSFGLEAQEETEVTVEENSENQEMPAGMSDLDKCMMKAKSMKDKKDCQKEHMKTVEEFIDEEGLELIEGYLKVYTDEDNINYYLEIDNTDLNKQFLYFAYIMNAPQGSSLTGGLPSDGKVLEFIIFQKDSIGLYQINTSYINGDDNNIGKSTITNITEAFIKI